MHHVLKTWPEPFAALWSGAKTFEFRRDDRDFQAGDTVTLREWFPDVGTWGEREVRANVPYVLKGGQFGIPDGYACLSLRGVFTVSHVEDNE